jgi:hypothetical protein
VFFIGRKMIDWPQRTTDQAPTTFVAALETEAVRTIFG